MCCSKIRKFLKDELFLNKVYVPGLLWNFLNASVKRNRSIVLLKNALSFRIKMPTTHFLMIASQRYLKVVFIFMMNIVVLE